MTDEELKKKGGQPDSLDNAAPDGNTAGAGAAATAAEKPDAVEQAVTGLQDRAKRLREYAASPVRIDKGGQTDWMSEIERVRNMYAESPEQQAARERRERTNGRIAALADGLVALSNVAGAMAGATPVKPSVTMSAAHRKAVEDAARYRRENARRYETARNYYAGLQYKQDKDNAGKEAAERKARQAAGRQADTLDIAAAKMRADKAKAAAAQADKDRNFEEKRRHNIAAEGAQAERNAISARKSNNSSGSGNGSQADWDEFAQWERDYPEEVNKIKTDNAEIDFWTEQPKKSVTPSTVRLVNAKMRQKHGSPGNGRHGSSSNKDLTRSGRKNNGKKSAI